MVKKIIFGIILAVGIFLRVYQMNSLPAGLFIDEISMAIDAKTLVQNGTDMYGRPYPFAFEDLTDFKLPGYIYPTAAVFAVLGPQIITVRFTAMVSSILLIFVVAYLAYILFPKKKNIWLFAGIVIALSPFAVHYGRIGYETMFATLFLSVYLISLVKLQQKSMMRWFVIGVISIIVSLWTYPGSKFIIPVFTLLWFFAYAFLQRETWKNDRYLRFLILFLGIAALTFIPSLIFPVDKRPLSYLAINDGIFASWIRNWNLEFLFDKGDFFAYRASTKEIGVFLAIFVIPYIIGILITVKRFSFKHTSLIFMVLFAAIAGLPSALTSPVPYGTRYLPMIIPITILISLGCVPIFEWIQKLRRVWRLIVCSSIAIVLIYQTVLFYHIYFVHFRQTSLPEFPKAPIELAHYIQDFTKKHPDKLVYFLHDRSCRQWSHDELYMWYFANLPNKPMIAWNNIFRAKRYDQKNMSPFDAYDRIVIPGGRVRNILLYPGYGFEQSAPKGSLFVDCGYQLSHLTPKVEKVEKILYQYQTTHQDPYYVISERI